MQAARLSYATDTRFIAIFLDAVAGKSPLKQRAKENLIVGVFDASPGRMDLSYGFFSRSQSGVNRHRRACCRPDRVAFDPKKTSRLRSNASHVAYGLPQSGAPATLGAICREVGTHRDGALNESAAGAFGAPHSFCEMAAEFIAFVRSINSPSNFTRPRRISWYSAPSERLAAGLLYVIASPRYSTASN
jgi:hypothetical protein